MSENMKKHIISATLAMTLPISVMGANIDFESNNDYKAIGVYDCWEGSPFRTGLLAGNAAIVNNPDKTTMDDSGNPVNGSAKAVGAQRSRFGSNLFGVRIDLQKKIQLTTTTKYYHVMINRPNNGRVALVLLGKRTDRPDQTGEEEQIMTISNNEVASNCWADAVFAVKGSNDVEIHSIVVVPECESPHARTEDFIFYIDDFDVNDDIRPRKLTEYYELNHSKTAKLDRTDRYIKGISLNSPTFGQQNITVDQKSDKLLYRYEPNEYLRVKAGETVTPSVNWEGSWMHSFVYIDRNDNGHFEAGLKSNGYTIEDGSDLMAFSCVVVEPYAYNSNGTRLSGTNQISLPSFTVPADLKPGAYRMRYKIDWNDVDPGGSIASGNSIISNGGAIVDVMLMVTGSGNVTVKANQLNGDVTTADGQLLTDYKTPAGKALKVKMMPAPGFTYSGLKIRHGAINGDSLIHENPQYRDVIYKFADFDSDNCLTIPASIIDGDMLLEGYFVEDGSRPKMVSVTYNLNYNGRLIATTTVTTEAGNQYPSPEWNSETSPEFYSIEGMPEGTVDEPATIELELHHSLPFKISEDYTNGHWYNLCLTSDHNYLTHVPGQNFISLNGSTTSVPDASDVNSQWCFIGNAIEGFMLLNRGAGEDMILSSNHNTSANTGGSTFPVMTAVPVPDTHNSFWIPTVSEHLTDGFFLHQLGHTSNCMNSRDEKLAYWTGGRGMGSTFTSSYVTSTSAIDFLSGDEATVEPEFYTLQGVKINGINLAPGIYICRRGSLTFKVAVR